ncbi:MAG: hypothetical protein IT355_18890 [Gemmatimonadaceae bacterium]|nr:hypothetical protein [Gemmatimonadaceae bacterium]
MPIAIAAFVLCLAAPALRGQAPPRFPEAWAGQWSGTLTTYSPPDSVRNRIPISLRIAREPAGGAWTWRTIFNADTVRGNRPYRLVVEDVARGHYATDEGNGVLLDETVIGGMLTSVFQVQSRVLESRYTLRGDTLVHELTWWDITPTRTVKGSGANAEGGAEIRSFRVQGLQRSVMVRAP